MPPLLLTREALIAYLDLSFLEGTLQGEHLDHLCLFTVLVHHNLFERF